MFESNYKNFNHLKVHSQYSICEGAIKIDQLKDEVRVNIEKIDQIIDNYNANS